MREHVFKQSVVDDKHSKEGKGRPKEKGGLFQNGREAPNTGPDPSGTLM